MAQVPDHPWIAPIRCADVYPLEAGPGQALRWTPSKFLQRTGSRAPKLPGREGRREPHAASDGDRGRGGAAPGGKGEPSWPRDANRILRKLGEGAHGGRLPGGASAHGNGKERHQGDLPDHGGERRGGGPLSSREEPGMRRFIKPPPCPAQIYDFGEDQTRAWPSWPCEFLDGGDPGGRFSHLSRPPGGGGAASGGGRALHIAVQTARRPGGGPRPAPSSTGEPEARQHHCLAGGRGGGDLVKVVDFGIAKGIRD